MKTLLVLRHAHARRASPAGRDHGRPLDERGRRDAERVGRRLVEDGLVPDLVLASTAVRAADTARRAAEAGGFGDRISLLDELYETDADGVVALLRASAPGHDRVLVVGHQPTLGELVALVAEREAGLATATLARIRFELDDWAHLGRGTGRLEEVWRPE